jgi:hypothetical protein
MTLTPGPEFVTFEFGLPTESSERKSTISPFALKVTAVCADVKTILDE